MWGYKKFEEDTDFESYYFKRGFSEFLPTGTRRKNWQFRLEPRFFDRPPEIVKPEEVNNQLTQQNHRLIF